MSDTYVPPPAREAASWQDAHSRSRSDFGVTHEVVRAREWSNPHGAVFVDIAYRCDPADHDGRTTSGSFASLMRSGGQEQVYRAAACDRGCWPHLRRTRR